MILAWSRSSAASWSLLQGCLTIVQQRRDWRHCHVVAVRQVHSDQCNHGWHASTCCELTTTEELEHNSPDEMIDTLLSHDKDI